MRLFTYICIKKLQESMQENNKSGHLVGGDRELETEGN